ncbi:MAG: ATP-binding protein [Synergistaceae bacterium]|jgi:two-component system phosphate regulon sensor histidine kinase PhoR|nr:ATP-binding protein [Synergistaceae bacterium]
MPRTLAGKLTALLALSVALAAILSWVFATRGMRAEIDDLLTDGLSRDADAIKEVLDSRALTSEELARWSELLEVRITIISSDGTVLADSSLTGQDAGSTDNHRDRPEVRQALLEGHGTDRRYSETTGIPYLYYASAFQTDGGPLVVRCSLPLSRYYDLLGKVRTNILLAHVLSGLAAVVGGILGVRRVTRPIGELTLASRAGLPARPRYPSGGSLEIEELSRAMKESAEAQERMMRELADDRDQLLTVVQSAPCGLMLVGADGKISCANGAFAPLLRDAPERLEGADADGALRAPELIALIAKGKAGESGESSFDFRYGASERCYRARALPAGQRETLLILDDITERRQTEEARKSFVADAGHELRTPLASISVAAELLGGMRDSGADERAPYIEEIMRQRDRMTALVDDLLLLSKLESGVPVSAARGFDLAELARGEINEAKKNPKSGHIAWEADIPDAFAYYGRPEEIRRSVANLLDNSVKYTHRRYGGGPGGRISVSLREEGGACVIKVTDNGTGIPKEEAGRLFGRFERLERDRARDGSGTGGYGLGLAIVKTAVESHGGKVTLKSKDGITEFTITLPQPR